MVFKTLNCCAPKVGVICFTFWYPKSFFKSSPVRSHAFAHTLYALKFESMFFFCLQTDQMTTSTALFNTLKKSRTYFIILLYYCRYKITYNCLLFLLLVKLTLYSPVPTCFKHNFWVAR